MRSSNFFDPGRKWSRYGARFGARLPAAVRLVTNATMPPRATEVRRCVLIDNPDKVHSLIANLESNLPLRARITPKLAESLREKSPGTVVPQECDVAAVHY